MARERVRRTPRQWGIAARSALTATVVVAGALVVGAVALLFVLDRALVATLDEAAAARTEDIVGQLDVDPPAELGAPLFDTDAHIALVQVIDPAGQVVRSSEKLPEAPITDLRPAVDGPPVRGVAVVDPDGTELRATVTGTLGVTGQSTVVVATSGESVEATLVTVAALLALGAPVVVAVAAVVTHRLVRRSLRSVEAIRTQVATISSTDLGQRVPVPAVDDEIAALATTMNDMLARLQAGHAAQRRFVADASHELRSPLTTVTAALDLTRSRPELLTPDLLSSTVVPEVERMRHLVDDLLLLARADEHGLPLHVTDVDLDDLVVEEVQRTTVPDAITVSTTAPPVRLRGDAARLGRLVRNLLDNAVRHAESTIDVRVHSDPTTARLTVTDDGPGIPEADRRRVFDRFVRLDRARRRSRGGAGLGLPIVAEIVAAHQGQVTITDSPGGGTRVQVTLPLAGPAPVRDSLRDSASTAVRGRP